MTTAVDNRWPEADLPTDLLSRLNDFMAWQAKVTPERQQSREHMADYFMRNRRAWLGFQAHDYCHGRDCQSCGCGASGPCVSHQSGIANIQDPRYAAAVRL